MKTDQVDQVIDCEDVIKSMKFIVENINEVIKLLDREDIKSMLQKILEGDRIFVMGGQGGPDLLPKLLL